jgi:F-type H+-transporting ATPase subunit epsilon
MWSVPKSPSSPVKRALSPCPVNPEKAEKAKLEAEEALKNAKSEVDLARAQSELAVMAAQIAALRKFRQKR